MCLVSSSRTDLVPPGEPYRSNEEGGWESPDLADAPHCQSSSLKTACRWEVSASTHYVNKYHHYNQGVGGLAVPLHARTTMFALEISLIAIKLCVLDLSYSDLIL